MNACINPLITCHKELADIPCWLLWRYEDTPGTAKPRKVPYYANGVRRHGIQGSQEDRDSLVDFKTAKEVALKTGSMGLGIAVLPEWGFFVVDFDNLTDLETLKTLCGRTYVEWSPSKTGAHAFLLGSRTNQKSHATENSFGVELFSSKGFVTFTGDAIDGFPGLMGLPSDALLQLIQDRFGRSSPALTNNSFTTVIEASIQLARLTEALTYISADCGYDQWVRIGMALHHESNGSRDGFNAWDMWSATAINKYISSEQNLTKWESFGRGSGAAITGRSILKMARENGYVSDDCTSISDNDFSDLGRGGLEKGVEKLTELAKSKPRFIIKSKEEFLNETENTSYLVKGLILENSLVILHGAPGTGKTFNAVSLAHALTNGRLWAGLKTRKTAVLYIAAEGRVGLRQRIKAIEKTDPSEVGAADFDFIAGLTPNLNEEEDIKALIRAISEANKKYGLIIIDTFAQSTAGLDENSAGETGKVLNRIKQAAAVTGAATLIVHHPGKNVSNGPRGSSSLAGAADAILEVIKSDSGRCIRLAKDKDGPCEFAKSFDLTTIILDEKDEDGDLLTSCVIEYLEKYTDINYANAGKGLTPAQQIIIDVLSKYKDLGGILEDELVSEVQDKHVENGEDRPRPNHVLKTLGSKKLASLIIKEGKFIKLSS